VSQEELESRPGVDPPLQSGWPCSAAATLALRCYVVCKGVVLRCAVQQDPTVPGPLFCSRAGGGRWSQSGGLLHLATRNAFWLGCWGGQAPGPAMGAARSMQHGAACSNWSSNGCSMQVVQHADHHRQGVRLSAMECVARPCVCRTTHTTAGSPAYREGPGRCVSHSWGTTRQCRLIRSLPEGGVGWGVSLRMSP
jgi:hypothetical protein